MPPGADEARFFRTQKENCPTKKHMTETLDNVWELVERFDAGAFCLHQPHDSGDVPMHAHNKDQLLYTEGGVVYVFTENKTWYLPARHYIWLPAGVKHSTRANSPSVFVRSIYFEHTADAHEFYQQAGIYAVNDMLLAMIYHTEGWGYVPPSDHRRHQFVMAIQAILPEVSRQQLQFTLPFPKDARLVPMVEYLQAHIAETHGVATLSKKFGISERSLERLFHSNMKMSCMSYMRTLRILRALELLTTTKLTVNEIAQRVGYESTPTFSNTFQQIMGVRPKAYVRY